MSFRIHAFSFSKFSVLIQKSIGRTRSRTPSPYGKAGPYFGDQKVVTSVDGLDGCAVAAATHSGRDNLHAEGLSNLRDLPEHSQLSLVQGSED